MCGNECCYVDAQVGSFMVQVKLLEVYVWSLVKPSGVHICKIDD